MATTRRDRRDRGNRLVTLGLQDMQIAYPQRDNSVLKFHQPTVRQDAQATRIIVHARYPALVEAFLAHKRVHGSSVELRLYGPDAQGWTWQDQVARLVSQRPLAFVGGGDYTKLRNGTQMPGNGATEWDNVGTEADMNGNAPRNRYLTFEEYLSYDEIMLGSLLGVSSPSYFINDGNRYNNAQRNPNPSAFEPRGIIVGLVGARFERDDRMDSVHCLRPVANPRQHPELTQIFQDFFFQGAAPGVQRDLTAAFDNAAYKARMRITIEILLFEANRQAALANRPAWVYIVGLGLGVWRQNANQQSLYVQTFVEVLNSLANADVDRIRTLDFAFITVPNAIKLALSQAAGQRNIRNVRFGNRQPAQHLPPGETRHNTMLVLSYAWDGNSFPGNEYWQGSLAASGDPAAAAMSTISELHNPIMNPDFLQRIEVLGPAPPAPAPAPAPAGGA